MPTVDHNIAEVNVEMVKGQGRSITFTNLLTLSSSVIADWTAVAGPSGGTTLTVTADGADVLVTWSDNQATSTLGKPWRLRWSGDDVAGGRVVEARPQDTPGPTDITITIQEPSPITVTVVGSGAGGASLSDDDPADLGVVDPGAATEAARADHVHAMPSAADVGADPAGSASAAQAAAEATAAAALAAHKSKIPHIQMTVSQPGGVGTAWRLIVPSPLRSAVYIPPQITTLPSSDLFEGVEVEAPTINSPDWAMISPLTGNAGTVLNVYDVGDHSTVLGQYEDAGAGTLLAVQAGVAIVDVVAVDYDGSGMAWGCTVPADASTLASAINQLAAVDAALAAVDTGKEDVGVAAALVDDLSGVSNQAAARSNLGLGTAATQASTAFEPANAVASGTRTGSAFVDVVDGDLWMATGNYTAGTVEGGVIRRATGVHVDWAYSQATDPTDVAVGTAFNVDWDTTITAGGGFGPMAQTNHFGPRSVYHLEGRVKYGVDATPYGFSPIPFGNTLLVSNTPGVARTLVPAWGFMQAGIHVADNATVTQNRTDVAMGGAAFVDSQVIATVDSGTWDGTTNLTEMSSFMSMPFAVGTTHLTARIGLDIMDINGTAPTDYNAVRASVATLTGKTADAGMGTVDTQYGLRVIRLANATRNIGISNASATVEPIAAKTITAAGNTLPIDATVVALNNTSGGTITLTSTPILADGLDGQKIKITNVSSQTVILAGEAEGGAVAGTANTNVRYRTTIAPTMTVELTYSSTLGYWLTTSQRDPLVDLSAGTANL
jgi:hypothetical protein